MAILRKHVIVKIKVLVGMMLIFRKYVTCRHVHVLVAMIYSEFMMWLLSPKS